MTQQTSLENGSVNSMKRSDGRWIWGILLILAGFFFLAQNLGAFGFFGFIPDFLWAIGWTGMFGIAGLAFLGGMVLSLDRNWWMATPGFALLGLAGTIVAGELLRFIPFEGSIFLGSLGLGFLTVFLVKREMWWALIPGGVLETLALVAAVDETGVFDSGSIFFLGMGLTFAVVAMVPTKSGHMTWAWIPAGVMLTLAATILFSIGDIIGIIWPIILVGVGVLILARNLLQRS